MNLEELNNAIADCWYDVSMKDYLDEKGIEVIVTIDNILKKIHYQANFVIKEVVAVLYEGENKPPIIQILVEREIK
jgi:phage pi2 protein 07